MWVGRRTWSGYPIPCRHEWFWLTGLGFGYVWVLGLRSSKITASVGEDDGTASCTPQSPDKLAGTLGVLLCTV